MTVGEWIVSARERLKAAKIPSGYLEAQLIAGETLLKERSEILAHPEWEIPADEAEQMLKRRLDQEPLAYILGRREFYGRSFIVTPDVLIPRHETETVIDAWRAVEGQFPADAQVLDLGTGSGCLGITIKLGQPSLSVTLCDISQDALEIAELNADRFGADVATVLSDGMLGLGTFDAIVTNPPYVAYGDVLGPDVERYEPKLALYAGKSGLEFYERLAKEAKAHLNRGGMLIMEVGDKQASSVRKLFIAEGWHTIRTFHDMMNIERVLAMSPFEPAS